MIVTPKQLYDIDELVLYNMHVHLAPYSRCAKPEMRLSDVIAECTRQGYRMVAFTNHFHEINCPVQQDNEKIKKTASLYPSSVQFLYGCELSCVGAGQMLDDNGLNRSLEYRLAACNHYHQSAWLHPYDRTVQGYCRHCLENTEGAILSGRVDTIAHPLHGGYVYPLGEHRHDIADAYTDEMLYHVMKLAAQHDVAWELNSSVAVRYARLHRRFWHIGREAGVTFVFGSDAHTLAALDRKTAAETLKSVLL